MSIKFKQAILCVSAIFLTVFASLILPFLSYSEPTLINSLNSKSGYVDLSGCDLSQEHSISLAGEWEFYWNKHIVSDNDKISKPDLYIDTPSAWTLYEVDGHKLSNGGIASYRVDIENLNTAENLVVSVNNLAGACKVFIDGVCVFSNRGIPGSAHMNDYYTYTNPVTLDSSVHSIVVEVDCEYSGGLTSLPELSEYHYFRHSEMSAVAMRYVIIGMVFFFAVGVMLISIIRRNMGKNLWLLLLCIVFAMRMLISNEAYMVSHSLFFDLNFEIMISLVFVSTYIIKLCMLMYLNGKLDLRIRQETVAFISAIFLISAFVPYFLYERIYVATSYMWLQSSAYLVDAFMIFKLSGAVIKRTKNAVAFLVFYCISTCAIVIDNFYLNGFIAGKVSYVMPIACMCFIAMMVVLYIIDAVNDYKQAQKTAELEKELSELNATLMLSQIQPHFLYNALNTIKYMIKKDPKTAERAVVKFAGYLRANMDSLSQKEPIPFAKEIDHVRNYVEIEKLRFGDRLDVEYCIDADNFFIPPLTVQPIVENAIKHGINQKPEGGTIKIASYEMPKSFVVSVTDNGVGYDVNSLPNDGRSHVGITNIKKRLKTMLGASVSVKSVIGEGTSVTITIPKNWEE